MALTCNIVSPVFLNTYRAGFLQIPDEGQSRNRLKTRTETQPIILDCNWHQLEMAMLSASVNHCPILEDLKVTVYDELIM